MNRSNRATFSEINLARGFLNVCRKIPFPPTTYRLNDQQLECYFRVQLAAR